MLSEAAAEHQFLVDWRQRRQRVGDAMRARIAEVGWREILSDAGWEFLVPPDSPPVLADVEPDLDEEEED